MAQPPAPHSTSSETNEKWPIVYSKEYNISFFGMEKLHPFDAGKWGNVFNFLIEAKMLAENSIHAPLEVDHETLLKFHSEEYIASLKSSCNVAAITEVPPVAFLPNSVVQNRLLKKFRFQTHGTIMACELALEKGWAINIGGGFHHCSADNGGGFCAYADISGALKLAREKDLIKTALIVDLDAHQGNGHERDFLQTSWVQTLDVYNGRIYPGDTFAKGMRNLHAVELRPYTEDAEFLRKIEQNIDLILSERRTSPPDVIAYNAGTDILEGDPLGHLSITGQGIIDRDELMFRKAREYNVPIFMVLSGGYQKQTARIIADSILNLKTKGLISK